MNDDPVSEEIARLRRLQGVGKFAAGLVHDFNNVLGAVVAFVDTRSTQAESELDRKLMVQLNDSLSRGVQLLRVLSAYSLDGPRKRDRVAADALINDVMTLLATSLRHAEVTVDKAVKASPQVRVQRAQIMELLVQLVLHSVDAVGPSSQLNITVEAGTRGDREFAVLSFEMDGDPSLDTGLQEIADRPEQGFSEAAEALDRQAKPILAGVLSLHLGGGVFEYDSEPCRSIRVLLPVCMDRS